MIDPDDVVPAGVEPDPAFLELTDQITERLQAGDEVDARDYLRRYPEWAGAIRKLLPTMNDLVDYGRAVDRDRRRGQRQIDAENVKDCEC